MWVFLVLTLNGKCYLNKMWPKYMWKQLYIAINRYSMIVVKKKPQFECNCMIGKEEKQIRRYTATPISLSSPHKDNLTKFLTNNIKSFLWISNCNFWISKEKPYEGKMLTNKISNQCK